MYTCVQFLPLLHIKCNRVYTLLFLVNTILGDFTLSIQRFFSPSFLQLRDISCTTIDLKSPPWMETWVVDNILLLQIVPQ